HRREFGEIVLSRAGERGVGEFFEERVSLAVDDAIALLDRGASDGLGEMTLARTGWPQKERILPLRDEARRGELVDEGAIHLLVEIEIKIVEGPIGIAKASQLVASLEETVLSPAEFVGDERGHEVDGCHLLGLRLPQPGLEGGGHAGQP